jgi:hypothetical protein
MEQNNLIESKVREMLETERRVYPCRSNRASAMGHECLRYLVYCRTNWQDKKVPEITLQYIFEMGNVIEDMALARLKKAGFEVTQQQRDFADDKNGITGHIDGYVQVDGKHYPLEIKSMSGHIWPGINTVEDMKKSSHRWVRGYPSQLNLYLYLAGKEKGLFYLVNKQTGEGKDIWMAIDYDLAERDIKKAEAVNKHMADKTVPDRIPFDPDMCIGCDFEHICLPPVESREQVLIEQEPAIEAVLNRREEVSPLASEYNQLDKKVKDYAKSRQQQILFVGNWMITKKQSEKRLMISINKMGEPASKPEEVTV